MTMTTTPLLVHGEVKWITMVIVIHIHSMQTEAPHGGLAYGLDRWVSLFAGLDSIRDCIAFPKNNSGRDVMLDAPSAIDQSQLDELNLIVDLKEGE